jgi:hypothetical protein
MSTKLKSTKSTKTIKVRDMKPKGDARGGFKSAGNRAGEGSRFEVQKLATNHAETCCRDTA